MKKNIKIILISVSVTLAVCVLAVLVLYIPFLDKEMMTFEDDGKYYRTIESMAKEKSEIDLREAFDFNWENAYIVSEQTFSGIQLSERIGVSCDLPPLDPHAPGLRIVFYNENEIVYDYCYDSNFLKIEPLDYVVSAENAKFVVSRERLAILKPTIILNAEIFSNE